MANSDGGRDYWREEIRRPARLVTIRNALDFKSIREARPPLTMLSRPLLLVVGRFTPQKAQEIIVRAVNNFSGAEPINVVMMGEGPERLMVEKEIAAASLSTRVKILPYQADWWRWLKAADGLISMSCYEGNPNVVLEAMAGRLPGRLERHAGASRDCRRGLRPFRAGRRVQGAVASDSRRSSIEPGGGATSARNGHSERLQAMTVEAMADAYDAVYGDVLNTKS